MIIGFAGSIASGKSVVAKAVADTMGVPYVSFGGAVRSEAEVRGLEPSRTTLQDLGNELIAQGWDRLWARVIDQVNWDHRSSLVVDGIRHLGAIAIIRQSATPSRFYLIFVSTPPGHRRSRLLERGWTCAEARMADQHPTEKELPAVRDRADLLIDNDGGLSETTAIVVSALRELDDPSRPGEV